MEQNEIIEPKKVYVIWREWETTNGTSSEEVARFSEFNMATTMLKALCERKGYRTEVDFEHLDCIWAVRAVWTGGGEAHNYHISEEYINPDGSFNDWA